MRFIKFLLIGIFFLTVATESEAQRRSSRKTSRDEDVVVRKRRGEEDKLDFKDKLAYDIFIGNLGGFNNGLFISTKAGVGYKVTDPFTVGLGMKLQYEWFNIPNGPDSHLANYGLFVYPRFRIGQQFYLKGEYNYFNLTGGPNGDRRGINFPMAGAGYAQGFGDWKFGLEVLIPISEEGRDNYTVIEYMISFIYNL